MAKITSDSILGVIHDWIKNRTTMLYRINMLGGGLRSPSAFLVLNEIWQLFQEFIWN